VARRCAGKPRQPAMVLQTRSAGVSDTHIRVQWLASHVILASDQHQAGGNPYPPGFEWVTPPVA
jgi:hypothetical protein